MGAYPCPRCIMPLTKAHLVGTKRDRKARTRHARVDNHKRRHLIHVARSAIYNGNYCIQSAGVERMLKPQSLVPVYVSHRLLSSVAFVYGWHFIQNAFSDQLSQFGLNFFELFVVDLMHEVELGVWKALFIHLLRILEATDGNALHELDRR